MAIDRFKNEYVFLSNFYICKVTFNSIDYKSIEHAYQAQKAIIKLDHDQIRDCNSAARAKKLGSTIPIRSDWESIKLQLMLDLTRSKFKNPQLQSQLLDTGEEFLVEGNLWHDNYWGSCVCPRCLQIHGENKLGKILEIVRLECSQSKIPT